MVVVGVVAVVVMGIIEGSSCIRGTWDKNILCFAPKGIRSAHVYK